MVDRWQMPSELTHGEADSTNPKIRQWTGEARFDIIMNRGGKSCGVKEALDFLEANFISIGELDHGRGRDGWWWI